MDGYERLSLLLGKTLESQNKLLRLEQRKTEILIKGSAGELDEILLQEQPLLMHISSLEQRREALQQELGWGNRTLREMIAACQTDQKHQLQNHLEELSQAVAELKKINAQNMAILHTRLHTLQQLMELTGVKNAPLTYENQGQKP